jgi:hypothetical protein
MALWIRSICGVILMERCLLKMAGQSLIRLFLRLVLGVLQKMDFTTERGNALTSLNAALTSLLSSLLWLGLFRRVLLTMGGRLSCRSGNFMLAFCFGLMDFHGCHQ